MRGLILAGVLIVLIGATVSVVAFSQRTAQAPVASAGARPPPSVTYLGPVAPDTLCLKVQAGRTEYGPQGPYQAQPGDQVGEDRWVKRDGRCIGALVGPKRDILQTFDRFVGQQLDTARAAVPASYLLSSSDDAHYKAPLAVRAVHRKTRPLDIAQLGVWEFAWPVEHTLYLRLPSALVPGCQYALDLTALNLPKQAFAYDPVHMRSDAAHISHLGFRPDDLAKIAFLSTWMGDGGGLAYPGNLKFQVLKEGGDEVAFEGNLSLSKAASDLTEDAYNRNYNGTDVYQADFSDLSAPGRYRVYVVGIGCSYPFEIGRDVWQEPFRVAARGFYHQRSGIALGPPYTEYRRPRCFHPEDGVQVYQSTCGLMDSGNGLNSKDTNFGNLVAGRTDEIVPNAWGGYMDAGDWDRRIQHLEATRQLLELEEMFPQYFASFSLNIPESGNGLPDIVDEALFNLDFYRRLQTEDGGIRGGIESAEHPRFGEASWQESLPVMAYAPCVWSSYVYAGVAARAAYVLQGLKPDLAATYRESALRALKWAEKELPSRAGKNDPHALNDARNLAAIEMFRLTGDEAWHRLFLETTALREPGTPLFVWQHHEQRDAAWVYLQTNRPGMDAGLKRNCLEALRTEADERVTEGQRTAFHWTKNPWAPTAWGALTSPDAISLCRAHLATSDPRYLRAAVLACQSGAGANPVNVCYTTGLGYKSPQHPLHVDSRRSHQPPPPGLTIYGPRQYDDPNDWALKLINQSCYPVATDWPTTEAYWDIFLDPNSSEYTVMQTMKTTAYTWGYLAARK